MQGDFQSASIGTFMAINGDGFFVVQKPSSFTDGRPTFDLNLYLLGRDGSFAGVTLRGADKRYAVADERGGARLEPLVPLFE